MFMVEKHHYQLAHHVSWDLAFGLRPEYCKQFDVMHICDDRRCIRPSHLVLGSRGANVCDVFLKGRKRQFRRSSPFA